MGTIGLAARWSDSIDLVFAQCPFEQIAFPDIAAYHCHLAQSGEERTISFCGTQSRTRQTT